MSTHPYIPLYVDDFEAATAHLSIEEDGVYSRLLRLCWRTPGCSIPADPSWIARKIRVDAETFERVVAPLLDEFFERRDGRIFAPQMERWIERFETPERRERRGLDKATRAFILERDGYTCTYCGESEGAMHVDHVFPVARGGKDNFENLVCACEPCNLSKGAKLLSEWTGR